MWVCTMRWCGQTVAEHIRELKVFRYENPSVEIYCKLLYITAYIILLLYGDATYWMIWLQMVFSPNACPLDAKRLMSCSHNGWIKAKDCAKMLTAKCIGKRTDYFSTFTVDVAFNTIYQSS